MKFSFLDNSLYRMIKLIQGVGKVSVLRALQNELIKTENIRGKVLDYGGGKKSSYVSFIQCEEIVSINIKQDLSPTHIIEIGDPIPETDSKFDSIICFNTLEHIFEPEYVIEEFTRVLKDKGKLYLTTPFMMRIHANPDDYFRPTPSWYRKVLLKNSFCNIEVYPLSWGPFSTAYFSGNMPGPFKIFFLRVFIFIDYFYIKLRHFKNKEISEHHYSNPLAYFVIAQKQS